MLKVLCALAHDEQVSREIPSAKWKVPTSWVEVLFDGRPLPPGAGIYTPRVWRNRAQSGVFVAKIVGNRSRQAVLSDMTDKVTVSGVTLTILWARPRLPNGSSLPCRARGLLVSD